MLVWVKFWGPSSFCESPASCPKIKFPPLACGGFIWLCGLSDVVRGDEAPVLYFRMLLRLNAMGRFFKVCSLEKEWKSDD